LPSRIFGGREERSLMSKGLTGGVAAVLLIGALLLLFATPLAGGRHARSAAVGCDLADVQPGQPLELNAVRAHELAKFVAMEKEIFHCTAPDGRVEEIRDVETFVELVKAQSRHGTTTVDRRVDVVTCRKNLRTGRVRCRSTQLPLRPASRPLAGCSLNRGEYPFDPITQPNDPVEMETVLLGKTAVTVKVEKEILACPGGLADVYLFTQVDESPTRVRHSSGRRTKTLAPTAWRFSGVVCFKDRARATVVRCRTFRAA
jgi:uncharacterized protein YjhX (UPF0386 family)